MMGSVKEFYTKQYYQLDTSLVEQRASKGLCIFTGKDMPFEDKNGWSGNTTWVSWHHPEKLMHGTYVYKKYDHTNGKL